MMKKFISMIMTDEVSEVLINAYNSISVKKNGRYEPIETPFANAEEYLEETQRFIESNDMGEGIFLAEGRVEFQPGVISRVHITMPPTSFTPQFTIAKRTQDYKTITALQMSGSFDVKMGAFLKAMIETKLTAVISGSAGAGKTTLLEALTTEYDRDERIGICEDLPELAIANRNSIYMHSTVWRPGMDPNKTVPLQWVVQQINRQRVDRVIVGECRGKEFFDFLTLANSGLEGALTSIHASNAVGAVKKMTTFVSQGIDIELRLINEMIANTVDIVIQIDKEREDPSVYSRITGISYVTRRVSDKSDAAITLHPLFTYNGDGTWTQHAFDDHLINKLELEGYNARTFMKSNSEGEVKAPSSGLPTYIKNYEVN